MATSELKRVVVPLLAVASFFGELVLLAHSVHLNEFIGTKVLAEEAAAPVEEKAELGPPPEDFGLTYEFYDDCTKVVNHMRYAVQMEKGNPYLAQVAQKTKDEMVEFVSYYRRFTVCYLF